MCLSITQKSCPFKVRIKRLVNGVSLSLLVLAIFGCGPSQFDKNADASLQLLDEVGHAWVSASCRNKSDFDSGIKELRKLLFKGRTADELADFEMTLNQDINDLRAYLVAIDWNKTPPDFYRQIGNSVFGGSCKKAQITLKPRNYFDASELEKLLGRSTSQLEGNVRQELSPMAMSRGQQLFGERHANRPVEWQQYGRLFYGVSTEMGTKGKVLAVTIVCEGQFDLTPSKNSILF